MQTNVEATIIFLFQHTKKTAVLIFVKLYHGLAVGTTVRENCFVIENRDK